MITNHTRPAVRLERTIPATPHEVYRAWLDPELLGRWLTPGFEVSRIEVDGRVGGHVRVWHATGGNDMGGFDAEILELEPDRRLVFRWGFVGPKRREGPAYDTSLTITLDATSDGMTKLTLVNERLDDLAAAMPAVADQVQSGWEIVVTKLSALLGTTK